MPPNKKLPGGLARPCAATVSLGGRGSRRSVHPLSRVAARALVTKSPPEDLAEIHAAAAAVVLGTATEGEKGSAPPWRKYDEYALQVFVHMISSISSCSALLGSGNDGKRLVHIHAIQHPHTKIGREEFWQGHDSLLVENLPHP